MPALTRTGLPLFPPTLRLILALLLLAAGRPTLTAAAAFEQVRLNPARLSLPSEWRRLGTNVPVWLHLHGDPATMETNFTAIGSPGILVNLTLPGLSKVYADHFQDPAAFPRLLRAVEAALNERSPDTPRRLGRLTVSSFSAGFGGVRQLLRQPAAFERLDALVMADSIYCGYAGDPAAREVDAGLMDGFLRFARLAAGGERRMVISHTQQVPEGYASTTETADYLIRELRGERTAAIQEWPGGLTQRTRFARGGLEILGFAGSGPEDHMRHLRQIGQLLERVRAPGQLP